MSEATITASQVTVIRKLEIALRFEVYCLDHLTTSTAREYIIELRTRLAVMV